MIAANIQKMEQMLESGLAPQENAWGDDSGLNQQNQINNQFNAELAATNNINNMVPGGELHGEPFNPDSCTLLVTGFPGNANDREIENYCRFMPGFLGAKCSFKRFPQVFVKFDSNESVQNAVLMVDQQPFDLLDAQTLLRAHIARTELKNPQLGMQMQYRCGKGPQVQQGLLDQILGTSPGGGGCAGPLPNQGGPFGGEMPSTDYGGEAPPQKRQRSEDDANMDTLVIMNLQDKNLDELTLRSVFSNFTGFMHMQVMPGRLGGRNCFVKYATPMLAQAAKVGAPEFTPEVARRSLNMPGQTGSMHGGGNDDALMAQAQAQMQGQLRAHGWDAPPGPQGPPPIPGGHGPNSLPTGLGGGKGGGKKRDSLTTHMPSKGPGHALTGDPNAKDTIVVMNIVEKGYSADLMIEFWPQLPGYCAMRISQPKGKGGQHCFAKFASGQTAQAALDVALAQGFDAEFSRNNMDPTQATHRAPGF